MPELKTELKSSFQGTSKQKKAREKAKATYRKATVDRARAAARSRSSSCPQEKSTTILPQYVSYYVTLGISESSTQRLIKNRFMKLAKTHHPDRNKV